LAGHDDFYRKLFPPASFFIIIPTHSINLRVSRNLIGGSDTPVFSMQQHMHAVVLGIKIIFPNWSLPAE
jgi:hypothetical protein